MKKTIATMLILLMSIMPLGIAYEEELPMQMPIKKGIKKSQPTTTEEIIEEKIVHYTTKSGSSVKIKRLDDGSITYFTKGRAIEQNNIVFRWEKGTYNTWIIKHSGTKYRVTIEDGVGINIKTLK